MRIYIAGPMRGYRHFNFPAFDWAAAHLRDQGHEVVSPADLDRHLGFDPSLDSLEGFDLDAAMRRDIEAILSVDTVVMLPGWAASAGASFEKKLAEALGLEVKFWDPDELVLRGSVFV